MSENKKQLIFERLSLVLKEVGAIGKNHTNQQQRYNYRSIDDVIDRLHGLFAKHSIIMSPGVVDSQQEVGTTAKGGTSIHVSLKVEYTFICSEDGSQHKVGPIMGEATDYGDKANAKAMTMATKTMLTQVFMIPFQDVYDTDENDAASKNAPVQAISTAQEQEVLTLIQQTGANLDAFLGFFSVGMVADLSTAQYPQAKAMLMKKKAKVA